MTTALEGGEWSAARPGHRKDLVSILQEAGWVPGLVWMGRNSIPDRPACSQMLY